MTGTLPVPPNGRDALYLPKGHDGREPAAVFHLTGWQSIFRFTVNLLNCQVDIASSARVVLVDMREHMGADRFDPMARSLLGEDRYNRICDRFERSWNCVGCDREVRVGWRYAPTDDGGSVCAACCKGYREYEAKLTKRPAPPVERVVTAETVGELV